MTQMAEVVLLERAFGLMFTISGDAVVELRLGSAIAADQYRRAENIRVVASKHQRDLGADAAADHDCISPNAFVLQYAKDIVAHLGKRERRARLGRAAPAAQIHGDGG